MVYLKWLKGRTHIMNTLASKTLFHIWWRNQKLSRQAKVKRTEQHHTSFTTNARKYKRKKRSTQNKLLKIKKMVIGSYILISTLNVNGLNAPTKRHKLAGWMKTCPCMHFHLPHRSAWLPPKFYVIILYC